MDLKEYYNKLFKYKNGNLYAKIKSGQRRKAGDTIGGIYTTGDKKYHRANINGKSKQVHNIIWIMHNGDIPTGKVVIHINNNTIDNRIENLTLIDYHLAYTRNKLRSDNSSGITGVSYYKRDNKWRAAIYHKGKVIQLGAFETIEQAKIVREQAMIKYNYLKSVEE